MYKIMTKLHTSKENVFAFHMVINDEGDKVEYGVETPEEAAEMALTLLGKVGYEDLRIVDDKSYYLDLIYGKKPEPIPELFTLTYENIVGYDVNPSIITDINKGETVSSFILFDSVETPTFHLIVDGQEYKEGNPEWIAFEEISSAVVKITYYGITQDHTVEIVIDSPDEPITSI